MKMAWHGMAWHGAIFQDENKLLAWVTEVLMGISGWICIRGSPELEAIRKIVGDTVTNTPNIAHHRADRDWNLHLLRREIVEIVHLVASKLQTSEFLVMPEEQDGANVQTIFFDAVHECFEGNCRDSGSVFLTSASRMRTYRFVDEGMHV
jgi:hypothetical protein